MMKIQTLIAAALAASAVFAQETAPVAASGTNPQPPVAVEASAPPQAPVAVEESQAKVEASLEAVKQDAAIAIDADEKVQEAFDEFLEKKRAADPSFTAYGEPTAKGVIYYAEMEPVSSKSAIDPDFLKKRQMAFARAFQQIRNRYIKYQFRGFLVTSEKGSFLFDGDAYKTQPPKDDTDAVQRLGAKVLALSEAKIDQELQKNGVDPSKFGTLPAKRKALSRSIFRTAAVRSLGSCTGVSVVKTVEGKGTDGQYSIGVIAKYDPEAVVIADCIARKVRPSILPKSGIPVGDLLKGQLAYNFGTRLYYDEEGMPALLSFGQWSSNVTPGMDRYERKLLEKSAFIQAEAQANIDMNNFIAGHMTYDEMAKAGESFDVNIIYSDDGVPVDRQKDSGIDEFVNWNSATDAKDGLGGRDQVCARTVKHPDTGAMITVVAVNWSFKKLDQLKRDAELRRPSQNRAVPVPKPAEKPTNATIRSGDTYDF